MTMRVNPLFQPAFLVCALLLLMGATTKSLVIRYLGWQLTKEELPLKKPLQEMDENALKPYIVKNKLRIDNPDIVATLGTEQYLQWILVDPSQDNGSPLQFCSVFVSYYTGDPDRVPHVPDECYVGGGNVRKAGYVDSAELNRKDRSAPQVVRYQNVLFGNAGDTMMASDTEFYVAYLFHANGQYCDSRTETRGVLGSNLLSKYSYFSKVEWQFYGMTPFGRVYPDRQEVTAASKRLLEVLLPVLEKDHWPDWEAANRNGNNDTNSEA